MRACSSLLRVHTIFSGSPVQPGHRGSPQGVGTVTQCHHKGWTHCQFRATSMGLFQFKSLFPTCIPFPFAARSAKGPISPHRIGTAKKDSQELAPALVSPLSPAPKAAQCCHRVPGPRDAGQDLLRPAALAPIPRERKGDGGTPSHRARSLSTGDRDGVTLLTPTLQEKSNTSALLPPERDWGCTPVRGGPTAQTAGSKQECREGA